MPASSLMSRVFLAVTVTIAVILMVVVACSRPSNTDQDQHALLSPPAQETRDASSPAALTPATQDPDTTSPETTHAVVEPEAKEGSEHRQPVPPAAKPAMDQQRQQEEEEAKPGNSTDNAPPESQATKNAPSENQAANEMPAAEHPAKSKAPPMPSNGTTVTQGTAAEAGNTPDETPEKRVDMEQEPVTSDTSPRSQKNAVVDPMKRLSREFARRRAASETASPTSAQEFTPQPPEVYKPIVAMTQEHRQTCLVYIGDQMPDATLADPTGKKHTVLKSLGKQLTVVVLWNANNPYALDQFKQLQYDVGPLADQGVRAIAIHVGPAPDNYQQLCQQTGDGTLCLLDANRQYFATLAKSRIPRTYLLDAQGKIVWLDIEYSRTTRDELHNALLYNLKDQP